MIVPRVAGLRIDDVLRTGLAKARDGFREGRGVQPVWAIVEESDGGAAVGVEIDLAVAAVVPNRLSRCRVRFEERAVSASSSGARAASTLLGSLAAWRATGPPAK